MNIIGQTHKQNMVALLIRDCSTLYSTVIIIKNKCCKYLIKAKLINQEKW